MSVKMITLLGLFTIIFFNGVLCIPEEMQELINTLHKTCVEETGASDDVIENARKGNFQEDDKLKCYMKCLLEQMGCVDDDGIIDLDATIAVLPEEYQEKGETVIRGCGNKKGANPCDNIFLTNKCWYAAAPDEYFLA